MHKNTLKQNSVASDVYHLRSGDNKKPELENILQSSIISGSNIGVHDFIKLNKQNTQQYTDLIELGEICLYHTF